MYLLHSWLVVNNTMTNFCVSGIRRMVTAIDNVIGDLTILEKMKD